MYKSDHLGVWLTVDWFALWHQRSLNEWKIFAIPLMLFLGSLLAPAVMLTGYARPPVEEWEPGWVMFLYGPLGLLDGQVGWRAGPGCLNRTSAWISGVSAGVRPPSGMAAG
jgi:hypothetical protein